MNHAILPLSVLVLISACSGPERSPSVAPRPRATLYEHATIRVGAPDWCTVDALLVRDGRVVAIGTHAELVDAAKGLDVEHVDLGGRVVVPGLHDAHGHLQGYGDTLDIVDLRGAASLDEVIARVVARTATVPEGGWVRGRGWDPNLWQSKAVPQHAALSAATPRHPVLLERVDGHAAFVNARALALAGLDGDVRGRDRLQGGEVLVDGDGHATGVLIDTATGLVERVIPAPTQDEQWARVERAANALVAQGLTSVHDMGVSPELAARFVSTPLALRAFVYVWGNAGLEAASTPRRNATSARANELVGAKLMIDGALGSRGAALLEDYSDAPGQRGHLLIPEERLRELVLRCVDAGLQPAVHAIGDHGNRAVLDAFADVEARRPELVRLRPRVEHAQIVSSADWARFEALGAIPSMQPTHATSDMPWAEERIGASRLAGAYAWRRLPGARTPLAFGSDFPVESPNPFEGLYAAITRTDARGEPVGGWLADQKLSRGEALDAFTRGAAYAVHREHELGKLEPGFLADFVVLDVDPLTATPRALRATRVLATVVGGERVFGALESGCADR
ncbi:MAG: amidohydrolase [Planctomycetes bacterium]|nr:amidohydrolase [Planctomycetota bacterium]